MPVPTHPARLAAIAAGKSRFVGAPCRACGGVDRYVYQSRCVSCAAARNAGKSRTLAEKDPEYYRRGSLRRKYKMTYEHFERLWEEQSGRCAICTGELSRGTGRYAVDHCHTSGRIRGLLCSPCNTAIGLLREDPSVFAAALTYLEQHRPA